MFKETIASLKNIVTISTHIKNLGKILNKTEDPKLHQLIGDTIMMLQQAHSNKRIGGKSTPGSLYTTEKTQIILLKNYCETFVATKKPEWQVLAERNGWTPPS